MDATYPPLCRSVFACGEASPAPEQYTQVWIDLINQIEQSKETVAAV